jgi:Ca2+-binding EF-hand superfamily protein
VRVLWRVMLVGAVAVIGCSRQSAPPVAKPSVKTPVEAAKTQADQGSEEQKELETPAVDDVIDTEVTATEAALKEPAPEPQPEKPPRPERIAILTPVGPLIVDVRITIAGRPYRQAFEGLIEKVMAAGDPDGDKRSTWKDFVANREYIVKEMQNAPAAESRQAKTFIERYDDNRDGRIQPAEAASWLGRDGGVSAAAFGVRSTRGYRPVPRATSQVWQLMDGDHDGRLSKEEAQTAPNRLLSFDADDDRIITSAELATLRELLQAAGGQQTASVVREANYYAAIHLEPDVDIERVNYLLTELYAPQQDLGPSSFKELSGLFPKLDENSDESLDYVELASLVSIEPHVVLSVAFEPAADEKPAAATVHVEKSVPEIAVAAQPTPDRVVLSLGNARLVFSAHNLVQPSNEEDRAQAVAQSQVRLMVHDQIDAVFEQLDSNADGRLGEREIAECADSMLRTDLNGDGQLSNDELPYSMIAAFMLGERGGEQSFYVPPSSAVSMAKRDAAMPTWFSRADLNGDGDVSRREFVGSIEQFTRLDSDQDGYINIAESAAVKPN